ncbi:BamA/TamA family outer membrane protein [Salegentibacter sp. JZCK2]|uniref:translocation and assembly module lipoprotein TamL n=1 Tax=Salegentibacter tibetensis TaxID=2873600 RepID=UPI001CC9625A|nr:BamA/TamA family outer membrane protein [Salegentibacter tibetensis]MBZ9729023.1 BamA/TamA family outer membrane protein [Salegentibacter tibetensis]
MKVYLKYIAYACVIFLLLQACNVKKFVPEDELLYTGAKISMESDTTIKKRSQLKAELESVLRPDPNSSFLGMQPRLYFHYKAQREKPGFINKFLNKQIGEEPVYGSDVNPVRTEDLLKNRLENRGFFYSTVVSTVDRKEEEKEMSAAYSIQIPAPYLLENYKLDSDSLPIYKEIQTTLENSPLEKGMRFDLSTMKLERERIDRNLKSEGYYNFNSGFLIFEADTNQYDQKKFDLFLRLKKDIPNESVIPYRIESVNIYPNYEVGTDSSSAKTRYAEKNFFQEEVFFKPKYLDPYLLIEEGQLYNPETSRNTARRLGNIGAYKFVNISYREIDSLATDSTGVLETNIYLSPLNKRSLRAEIQAVTKSNGFTGPSLALGYTNRNLFKGGEILNITGNFGYEVQVGGGTQAGLESIQLGLEGELIFPRLLFPIKFDKNWFSYSIPKTRTSLGVDYLSRSNLFSLRSASARFGYIWNANRFVTHELNPVSVNYVKLGNTSQEFRDILENNPFLQNSFNQEFIAGLTYSFTYNELVNSNSRHQFFLNSTLDVAGNLVDAISGGGEEDPQTFLGLAYAQYAKADIDFRYHLNVGSGSKIASRLFAGYGVPYGNSDVLPFTKQYFSGGPYSVRAFNIRSLGPGTYTPPGGEGAFFDQAGNIRLEANLEYRFPLFPYLYGAVFADAGNVWNTGENSTLEGGQFSKDFMNELGIGTGFGLRVDIQSFVIRVDLAAPVHDPSLPEGQRWEFDYANPVLNFAIGYPF